MTFEIGSGAATSKTPPGCTCACPIRLESRMARGRRCFFTTFRFSTMTRRSRGWASMIRPCFPRSLPEITWTRSPFLSFIAWAAMSEHLRGEADDLHEVLLAELARHGSEDTRAARVVGVVDEDGGVLVERDRRSVVPAEGLLRADDDRLHD